MLVGGQIEGSLVRIATRNRPLRDMVYEYAKLSNPVFFERQFGHPLHKIEEVIASVEAAEDNGFSSYFDIYLLTTDEIIGHIRVDWSIESEGLISLHGGSPYGTRAQACARLEAWTLMVRSALNTRGVKRLGTATSMSNKQAQTFIAATGFRRVRMVHLTNGLEAMIHYRLVSEWVSPAEPPMNRLPSSLDPFIPSLKRLELRPRPESDLISAPSGWQNVTEKNQEQWLTVFDRHDWLVAHLAKQYSGTSNVADMLEVLRFEAMCGTQFMGHSTDGQVDGLISFQALPGRPGWCYLRGGAIRPSCPVEPVKNWLDQLFDSGLLLRAEVQSPAQHRALHEWWLGMGFFEEGVTEVSESGLPIEVAFARLSRT
jgi:hypothetical protein